MKLIATSGYIICALAFLILTVVLRSSWQGKLQGALVILTTSATMIWGAALAYSIYFDTFGAHFYLSELFRDSFWIAFLMFLTSVRAKQANQTGATKLLWIIGLVVSGIAAVFLLMVISSLVLNVLNQDSVFQIQIICFLLLSLIGLILIEQLFRNSPLEQRWALKFFSVGVGGIFAYDFYLFSDALLFHQIDENILGARGYINTLVVPLITISAARNPEWTLPVHVSRRFVFHSAALMGAGLYLIAMAAGGYYLKVYGGTWGAIAQSIFLFGALLLLGLLLFSGNVRAKLKIFLAENFFNYKYDYRQEWLRLISSFSEEHNGEQIRLNAIKAIADIVESPAGVLWFKDKNGNFRLSANWNMEVPVELEPKSSSLVEFSQSKEWVIDLDEYHNEPELYEDLVIPSWMGKLSDVWLVLPLMHQTEMWGFAILAHPRVKQKINWEDQALLLTVGRQITNYIALLEANEALYEAQQFDAFNRLSAYVVHDLKNIVAQLSLVVSNAAKHRHNPAFMDDAINTINNATKKMHRLLGQLRKGRIGVVGQQEEVNLVYLLQEAIGRCSLVKPIPQLVCDENEILLSANKDRLLAVLEHLIQNAQEATQSNGFVMINCESRDDSVSIEIKDNGCGMSAEFIKHQLFRPFQTTKGNAGMGIGVYESKEYLASMNGTIAVESELDKGTTFSIRIPMLDSIADINSINEKAGNIG